MLRYFTSCARRRLEQYESISWWDFLGGDDYSPSFQRLLVAVPRTMVAMDPRRGSARTVGDVSMQLLTDHALDGARTDRLLCGPTSETWIEPWRRHLESLGRALPHGRARRAPSTSAAERWRRVELADGTSARADQFVLALPLEALRPLIGEELADLDPGARRACAGCRGSRFDRLTSWMSGIQFYLRRDVPIVRGHLLYPDAPWALTSVSQAQFWREDGALEERYGDGSVRGLISVDISEFDVPGTYVRQAGARVHPGRGGQRGVAAAARRGQHQAPHHAARRRPGRLAPGRRSRAAAGRGPGQNARRCWSTRPARGTTGPRRRHELPNLTLAADYVRTHTNIASMEGANEAARRAVNAILDRDRARRRRAARCGRSASRPSSTGPSRSTSA